MSYVGVGVFDPSSFAIDNGVVLSFVQAGTDAVRAMQAQVNRWASTVGFGKLVVDGGVGPATARAVIKTAEYIIPRYQDNVIGELIAVAKFKTDSPEARIYIARNSAELGKRIKFRADSAGLPAAGSTAPKPQVGPPLVVGLPAPAAPKAKTATMASVGLAAAALWYFFGRKKR